MELNSREVDSISIFDKGLKAHNTGELS